LRGVEFLKEFGYEEEEEYRAEGRSLGYPRSCTNPGALVSRECDFYSSFLQEAFDVAGYLVGYTFFI
jgi:hypothetical protein